MKQEEATENKNCDRNQDFLPTLFLKILMAYKKLLVCSCLLAMCYFVGVTWAETIVSSNASLGSTGASIPNGSVVMGVKTSNDTSSVVLNTDKSVKASTATNNITPAKCSCDGALIPRLAESDNLELCPECKCQHEARNTTLIKVVVIIVIWIISILVIYMLFLMCLDPLLNKRVDSNYQEHIEDEDTAASVAPPMVNINNQDLYSRANVLNRVSHQQDKWKRQVREQRRHIYDRRTMLN